MISNDWPLIFFTLLSQTATGLILTLAFLSAGRKEVLKLVYTLVNRPITLFALMAMACAVLFSFLHLGSPARAVYALTNLSSSWLSRELLMVLVFGATLTVRALFLQLFRGRETLNRIMLWLCVVAGTAMIYSMARLYMIAVVPSWNQASTMVLFFSGSLLLGIPLFLTLLVAGHVVYPDKHGVTGFSRLLVSVVIFAFLVRIPFALQAGMPSVDAGFPPPGVPVIAGLLYYVLMGAGTVLLMAWAFMRLNADEKLLRVLVPASFFLLLLGEVLGKYIFYSGYYRVGI